MERNKQKWGETERNWKKQEEKQEEEKQERTRA